MMVGLGGCKLAQSDPSSPPLSPQAPHPPSQSVPLQLLQGVKLKRRWKQWRIFRLSLTQSFSSVLGLGYELSIFTIMTLDINCTIEDLLSLESKQGMIKISSEIYALIKPLSLKLTGRVLLCHSPVEQLKG